MIEKRRGVAMHGLLPKEAIDMLTRAASVEPTESDPRRRQKAIERATEEVRARFPHLFREEDPE